MKRFAARYVYTLEGYEPLKDAFVEISDEGEILRTGPAGEGDTIIEGALVPGFVNAHCHLELSYMWKLFRKGTGMAGFIDQINALRDTKPMEEKLADIDFRLDQMLGRGVVAMADISNCEDSFAAKSKSRMYTRTFLEVFGTEPEDCDSVMDGVRNLARRAAEYGIDAAPTPHSCYTMSPELLTASSAEGLKSGFLSFHSEESDEEEEMVRFGRGPMWDNRRAAGMSTPPVTGTSSLLYFLDRLQCAIPAPIEGNVLLVHEVCMDKEGIDAAKSVLRHPFVALCPLSNIYIHNALPPVPLMRREGLKLTIGTDSLSSNDDLDMVAEVFCLQKNFPEVPVGEILSWACKGGAEFLGKEDMLGTFTPGKRPGVVLIDNISQDGRLTEKSTSKLLAL